LTRWFFELADLRNPSFDAKLQGSREKFNLPCVNNLPGSFYIQGNYYSFQVPGTGTVPVTFFMRVSDARGDARPDFIYTFNVYGVN
jgi:hypothetical protein